MARLNRFAAATALAAAFSLAATPAFGRGYHHHWHHWHRDRVDAGDVIAGAAIIGGIAAIASAMSKRDRAESSIPPPPPVPHERQGYADDGAPPAGLGLDRAADMCADAVDGESSRVDFVDNVTRDAEGWAVTGVLVGGGAFSCRIGNDGRLGDVSVGGERPASEARAEDGDADNPPEADDRPVWHGEDAQADDGRYSASEAPDFGERT